MHRLQWDEVPASIRAVIGELAGGDVTSVHHVEGGYSPCLAATLELETGRRVFVKAVSGTQNPDSPSFVRREVDLVSRLPAAVPAPALLGSHDDGDWVVAVFEHVDGRLPVIPWNRDELSLALAELAHLNATVAPADLRPAGEALASVFDGWSRLVENGSVPGRWAHRAPFLVELERRALEVIEGDHLVHNDIRHDNMLVTPQGRIVFVDWAHACKGVPWLDTVLWLPALELEGGGSPTAVLQRLDATRRPPHDALRAVVAACTGYFVHQGQLPDPPGLPTVRAFQRAQAETAGNWLAVLLDDQ